MLPIAFLLDGPPRYELFEQQLLLCVYVPLAATLFIRVILLQYPKHGRIAALVCAIVSAAVIIVPSYRYVRFGHPYAPSIAVLMAPWIAAMLPIGALAVFLRRQTGEAPEMLSALRTLLSHSAVVVTSVACIAFTIEFADTLNRVRLTPHLPNFFAPEALMRATVLFTFCEAARQLLLRRRSVRRTVYGSTILVVAIVNAFTNVMPPTWALSVVLIFLAVYFVNVVSSGKATMGSAWLPGSSKSGPRLP
ncbi:hypothetical protein [Opitutus sp. ER46]|uniref:hypothetical protein n=1 Tax=Opitutus sp. ER46 TaxID=2161864 RepID=UPI000D2F83AE|nr:hypothetical protein [Opitutus sp. ER46]PTX94601.1 hypothetical protein DB354_12790 [Opitutus sp. ER46]